MPKFYYFKPGLRPDFEQKTVPGLRLFSAENLVPELVASKMLSGHKITSICRSFIIMMSILYAHLFKKYAQEETL